MIIAARYSAKVIVGRQTFVLLEEGDGDSADHRTIDLWFNERLVGGLVIPRPYLPGYSADDQYFFVWGGPRLYTLVLETGKLREFDLNADLGFPAGEVRAVYPLRGQRCVICEHAVLLWEPESGVISTYCQQERGLLSSWWTGGRLYLDDLDRRTWLVEVDEEAASLAIVPAD